MVDVVAVADSADILWHFELAETLSCRLQVLNLIELPQPDPFVMRKSYASCLPFPFAFPQLGDQEKEICPYIFAETATETC